jgi:hypothetical protein
MIGWRHHTFEDGIIQAKSFPEAVLPQYFSSAVQGTCAFDSTVLLFISDKFLIKEKLSIVEAGAIFLFLVLSSAFQVFGRN